MHVHYAWPFTAFGDRVRRERVVGNATTVRRVVARRAHGPFDRRIVVTVRVERTLAHRSSRTDRRAVFVRSVYDFLRTAFRVVPIAEQIVIVRSAVVAIIRIFAVHGFRSTATLTAAATTTHNSRAGSGTDAHRSAQKIVKTPTDRRAIRATAVHRRLHTAAVSSSAAFDRTTSRARADSDQRKKYRRLVRSDSNTGSSGAKHIFHHTSVENLFTTRDA